MTWTSNKPDKPGWWWYRDEETTKPVKVDVRQSGVLVFRFNSWHHIEDRHFRNGQWSDQPITEPEEP